jgi:hypothetical protein
MIRTAATTEIQNVACGLWALLNRGASWPGAAGQFDLVKSAACAIVAHLAYCAIGADEMERRNRAKVVPCGVYQRLIGEPDFDFPEIMRTPIDLPNVEVIRTRYFVAILVPVREDRLIVGIRGTQFAYDWLINLNIAKAQDGHSGNSFHVGFLREAQELSAALRNYLGRYRDRSIYLAGHSLGGAVAILMNLWDAYDGCYTFGAPRVGNIPRLGLRYEPFAMRRHLDIVPHCPPAALRYANPSNQIAPDGKPFEAAGGLELYFFGSWLLQLSLSRFPEHHAMERYRLDLMQTIKQDPDFARWLERCPDIEL